MSVKPNLEQKFLQEYTGRNFPAEEAKHLWLRIIDHKWFMSEKLNRDIGLRVAAVDYVQNFYHSPVSENKESFLGYIQKFFRTIFYSIGPPTSSKKYTY